MRPSREARIGIGSLLAIQLATSAAGVGLLGRTSPAVEKVLVENVDSTDAVAIMLHALATRDREGRFHDALDRARANITETEETPLIDRIATNAPAALRGDAAATAAVADDLVALGAVNRASIEGVDSSVRQLGLAGGWAMAMLGFTGFLISLRAYQRIEERLLRPIVEIGAVLDAARSGDEHRRCDDSREDAELHRVKANLNWVLDRAARAQRSGSEDPGLRAALVATIDLAADRAAIVVNADGAVIAMNTRALDTIDAPGALAADARTGLLPAGWSTQPLDAGAQLLLGPTDPPT